MTAEAFSIPEGEPVSEPLKRRLYSVEETAEMLNVSVSWLYKAVRGHKVPYTKLGTNVRFSEAHMDASIALGEQPTTGRGGIIGRGSARTKL
jgi:excisionase family DNA binding protein